MKEIKRISFGSLSEKLPDNKMKAVIGGRCGVNEPGIWCWADEWDYLVKCYYEGEGYCIDHCNHQYTNCGCMYFC